MFLMAGIILLILSVISAMITAAFHLPVISDIASFSWIMTPVGIGLIIYGFTKNLVYFLGIVVFLLLVVYLGGMI